MRQLRVEDDKARLTKNRWGKVEFAQKNWWLSGPK